MVNKPMTNKCILITDNIRDKILEIIRLQIDILHYKDIVILEILEDGTCKVVLSSDEKSYDSILIQDLSEFNTGKIIYKSETSKNSVSDKLFEHFDVQTLVPIPFDTKCRALMGINTPVPMFTNRQIDVANFACSYIANLIANEAMLRDLENYSGRMQKMLDDIVTLHEITHALESNDSLDTLLEYIMIKSQNVLGAEAASLMLVIEETNELEFKVALGPKAQAVKPFRLPIGQGISGWVAESGQAVLITDAYSDPRFDPSFDKRSGFITRSMLGVPMIHKTKTVGVVMLINKLDGTPFNENDQILFTIFASQAALSIENARLLRAAIEKERLDKELQVAREIQNLLIPHHLPECLYMDMAAEYIPCKEVGGDFYDVIPLDNERYIFVVADVSGKGIPGALVVSNMQATLRAFLEYSSDLLPVVSKLNASIIEKTTTDRYITFFICMYDHKKSELTYINAGHNPPLLVSADGKIEELKIGGIFIGFMPWEYEIATVPFYKGDTLVMYTDGLVEAMNTEEEEFEMDRLKETILDTRDRKSEEIKKAIIERVHEHIGENPLTDDFTLLINRRIQ
ncbi:MAG: GAF domain-containing protein [Calditrichales bacterium]|nr:MAG: GAF domain-containing protein [Calditrichales bacterium]